ncbi:probable polygalacturonase At1g80170 [Juglans microcarpa x Juglans regia]|uniref:probable polygalacturonase At1g80170 n=1 Tax=Juglans microcarpa x Juglans regia TaxID=2249226 RepID=UPI001B7EE1A0|nr:probable polygalacturonase At1g80170 [Juglans microcarpa x Juglans regia]
MRSFNLYKSINLAKLPEQTMDKLFLASFLGILITAHGVAGNMVCDDDIGMLEELESLEIEEENEMELSPIPAWTSERGSKVLVNVDSFGAVGDGVSDDTQAFLQAWDIACSTPKSVLLVPEGGLYLVNATRFKGPCSEKLVIQIEGTIIAPDEPENWDPELPRIWLDFSKLKGVIFQGDGVIDGSGSKWWASSCKRNKTNGAPTALTIDSSSAIKVKGLTIQNSQQMHFVISQSDSVRISGVQVSAPGDSPNTDGIHITESTNVLLQDCKIGTGDDCISIVNASSNIKMKSIYCGPGHGISIGSLGKNNSTGIVTKVLLDKAFLKETTNGLRIKTWQGGSGYVREVTYQNVRMDNVSNPIIIDQFYCDSPKACQNQTSAVNISQIVYRNISGTTKSAKAMQFACSDTVPCRQIVLSNINLEKKDGTVETYCNSAQGFGYGTVHPSADCLSSNDKECVFINQEENLEDAGASREHIVHTEL